MKMGENKKFKFDVVIGNPPYQEETSEKQSTSNNQKPVKNIFQYFQEQAETIANKNIVMIYPGGRWIQQFGKGLNDFGLKQINDPHLRELIFYPNAKEVFPEISLSDGISIVLKDMDKTSNQFKYVYIVNGKEQTVITKNPGTDLLPLNPIDISIADKIDEVVKKHHLSYLHDSILPRSLFKIESSFVEENPDSVKEYHAGEQYDENNFVKLFTNDKAGKSGRAKWFLVKKDKITANQEYIRQWQVVVSSANAGGQKRDNQLEIIDNHSAFGRSRVALRSFKTFEEARNFYKFVSSYLVRYTFLMTDESLTSLGKRVPDLDNYENSNGIIDFNGNIDAQLYKYFGITESEKEYIENRVKNIRNKKEMA